MSDPWVLLTGSKGLTGPQLPLPSAPVRRFCAPFTAPGSVIFRYAYHWDNYTPGAGAGFAPPG